MSDLNTHGKYQRIEIKNSFEKKSIETRLVKRAEEIRLTKDVGKIVETELLSLVKRLDNDLSSEIFEDKTVEVIELTRNVCDLRSIAEKVDEKGAVLVGLLTEDLFVNSARQITNTIEDIPDDILKSSYKKFLNVLENHIKKKEKGKYDSKDLIKDFLNTEFKLYSDIEVTVQSICASAVKISVEGDVESLVSRYDKYFKIDRQLDETQAEHEMEISENGPLISHADKLLNKAMNSY